MGTVNEREHERLPLFHHHHDHGVLINPSPDQSLEERQQLSCGQKIGRNVRNRLPILQWLPKYQKNFIVSDLIAGITVTLTAIPQSIAYAAIAGLSPEYGLYSHFVGPLLYVLLGSCRQVTIGPTAVVELMTFQTCGANFPSCVILLGFYSGIVELLLGFLRLGFLISFISEPVTIGFTAGAVGTIASSQIKSLLGLSGKSAGSGFIASWKFIISRIHTFKISDAGLGISSIAVLLLLQKLRDVKPPNVGDPLRWKKAFQMITLGRNAIVLIAGSLLAFILVDPPFAITGTVKSGFPPVGPPSFTLVNPSSNATEPMSFTETLGYLKTGPLIVALMAILQNVAISKAFGIGQSIDATQEMFALGATNVVGGFFSCLPTSGSFTRSAIADASGVKSQLNGIVVGILILLSLSLLTSSFQYIPKASLAGVIVVAVIFMVDYGTAVSIYKTSKLDFLVGLVTFLCSLFLGMEYGILIGVSLSICILLYRSLSPSIHHQLHHHSTTKLKYISIRSKHGGFNFPSVDGLRDAVNKLTTRYPAHTIMVIHCDKWTQWDFTSLSSMVFLAKVMKGSGRLLVFYNTNESWTSALDSFGKAQGCPVTICYGEENLEEFFYSHRRALSKLNAMENGGNANPEAGSNEDDKDDGGDGLVHVAVNTSIIPSSPSSSCRRRSISNSEKKRDDDRPKSNRKNSNSNSVKSLKLPPPPLKTTVIATATTTGDDHDNDNNANDNTEQQYIQVAHMITTLCSE